MMADVRRRNGSGNSSSLLQTNQLSAGKKDKTTTWDYVFPIVVGIACAAVIIIVYMAVFSNHATHERNEKLLTNLEDARNEEALGLSQTRDKIREMKRHSPFFNQLQNDKIKNNKDNNNKNKDDNNNNNNNDNNNDMNNNGNNDNNNDLDKYSAKMSRLGGKQDLRNNFDDINDLSQRMRNEKGNFGNDFDPRMRKRSRKDPFGNFNNNNNNNFDNNMFDRMGAHSRGNMEERFAQMADERGRFGDRARGRSRDRDRDRGRDRDRDRDRHRDRDPRMRYFDRNDRDMDTRTDDRDMDATDGRDDRDGRDGRDGRDPRLEDRFEDRFGSDRRYRDRDPRSEREMRHRRDRGDRGDRERMDRMDARLGRGDRGDRDRFDRMDARTDGRMDGRIDPRDREMRMRDGNDQFGSPFSRDQRMGGHGASKMRDSIRNGNDINGIAGNADFGDYAMKKKQILRDRLNGLNNDDNTDNNNDNTNDNANIIDNNADQDDQVY